MSHNADITRFLMLTLGFTAAFMHVFGVELLQWQISHSSLYAYTLALGSTSLSGTEGLNAVLYTVTCLAMGTFFAWAFGIVLSFCEYSLHKSRVSQCVKSGYRHSSVKLDAVCKKGDKP